MSGWVGPAVEGGDEFLGAFHPRGQPGLGSLPGHLREDSDAGHAAQDAVGGQR
ncbi:hypothetical protein ACTFTM_20860 [Micromonospora sp. RB23]